MNHKNNKSTTNKCDNKNSKNRNYENNNSQMTIKVIIIINHSNLRDIIKMM